MIDTILLNKLIRLSGMAYKSGWYTPQEWEQKTGIDPLSIPQKYIDSRYGLCLWTKEAEKVVKMSYAQVERDWNSIGCKNR